MRAIQAQDGYGQFENPTGVLYSVYLWPLCTDPLDPSNGFVAPSCLGDATEEPTSRVEIVAEDRFLRSGLLLAAQIWAGVEYVRNIVQHGLSLSQLVESVLHGTTRPPPRAMAIRITDATDALEQRLTQATHLATAAPFASTGDRYADVHALVMRGLGTSRDAQAAATTLADQASGMQARITNGGIRYLMVGAGPSALGIDTLPQLPVDAAPDAMAVYATVASLPSTDGTDGALGASGGAATPASDTLACPLEDENAPDPQTLYERTSVMAAGAQTGVDATDADVRRARDEMRAVRERERDAEHEARWLGLWRAVSTF
jgi:hypothetical protein